MEMRKLCLIFLLFASLASAQMTNEQLLQKLDRYNAAWGANENLGNIDSDVYAFYKKAILEGSKKDLQAINQALEVANLAALPGQQMDYLPSEFLRDVMDTVQSSVKGPDTWEEAVEVESES